MRRRLLRLLAGRVGYHSASLRGFATDRQEVPKSKTVARAQWIEYRRPASVTATMRAIANRLRRVWVGPAALILAAALLGTFRPVLRFHGQRSGHSGLHQPILLSEATESSAGDRQPPVRGGQLANQSVSAALVALLASVVTIVLKARRTAFVPIAVRRLKLPRAAANSSPSS
jgi:hypothetical protein